MALTKKNHYNPCFWIAFWNTNYLNSCRQNKKDLLNAREQKVCVLNLRANRIFENKTENIFFQKKAGLAKITKEDALDFCKREHPSEYRNLKQYYREHPETLILDFENHFSVFENQYRDQLEDLIIKTRIDDLSQKTMISFFVFTQLIRNHKTLGNAVDFFSMNGFSKFEIFVGIKNLISSTDSLMKMLIPIVSSEWILYKTDLQSFPISDGCVLMNDKDILLPLSPDLLLKINYHNKIMPEIQPCIYKNNITESLLLDFTERTIQNSDREIVISDKNLLKKWQSTPIYQNKLQQLNNN